MPALELRSRALQAIRRYFIGRGFIEVETPVRTPAPALELHIDAEPAGDWFLRTSPELYLKRLLAGGASRVFEMGPCFRRGERGRLHNPEYTMLEWYRTGADYLGVLEDAEGLISAVLDETVGGKSVQHRGQRIDLTPPWDRLTVRDAFLAFAGWDPTAAFEADRFDLDLVEKVEPRFPSERPLVLLDYPVEQAALARCTGGSRPVAERWELYAGGMELANAFSELTDAVEQRRRFQACAAERGRLGKDVYPLNEAFLAALDKGLPACAGVALGVDRLIMLLADSASIDEVRAFRE